MVDQELGNLRQMLDQLYYVQNRTWLDPRQDCSPKEHVMAVYGKLQYAWGPMPRSFPDTITQKLGKKTDKPGTCNLAEQGYALYLAPPHEDDSLLPIVTFELTRSIEGGRSKLVLKPRLLLVHCERRQDGGDMSRPHGMGFRFDQEDSAHPYCHSQVCSGLAGSSSKESHLLEIPCWLPESIPAIPLRAKGAVGLLLCLLVSLYGVESDVIKDICNNQMVQQALGYIRESN